MHPNPGEKGFTNMEKEIVEIPKHQRRTMKYQCELKVFKVYNVCLHENAQQCVCVYMCICTSLSPNRLKPVTSQLAMNPSPVMDSIYHSPFKENSVPLKLSNLDLG